MKRRYRYMLNLFSLGLLAFALYLNFVKKETADVSFPVNNEKATGAVQKEATRTSSVNHAQSFVLK